MRCFCCRCDFVLSVIFECKQLNNRLEFKLDPDLDLNMAKQEQVEKIITMPAVPLGYRQLGTQVAGHRFEASNASAVGLLQDGGGEGRVFKPMGKPECGEREINFYESLSAALATTKTGALTSNELNGKGDTNESSLGRAVNICSTLLWATQTGCESAGAYVSPAAGSDTRHDKAVCDGREDWTTHMGSIVVAAQARHRGAKVCDL